MHDLGSLHLGGPVAHVHERPAELHGDAFEPESEQKKPRSHGPEFKHARIFTARISFKNEVSCHNDPIIT